MNAKYRALVWEQRQVSGAIAVVCFAVGTLLIAWLKVDRFDDAQWAAIVAIGMSMLAAGCCVLGLDPRGHLTAGFDMRLARLPVRTAPLVLIALTVRTTILLLLGLAFWLFYGLFFAERYPAYWMFAPAEMYLLLQSLMWSRKSVTGLSYPLALIGIALFALLVHFGAEGNLEDTLGVLFRGFAHPVALAITAPFAVALALAGVHWLRRDEHHGPPAPTEIIDGLRHRRARANVPFASALEAQVWYEWKRSGGALPSIASGIWLVLMLIWLLARDEHTSDGAWMQFLPYIAVVLAAPLAGLVSGVPSIRRGGLVTPYPQLRPLSNADLASAKMLAKARALFFTMLGAFALSSIALALIGGAEMETVSAAFGAGYLQPIELFVILTAPALLAAALAWVLLWMNIWLLGSVVLIATLLEFMLGEVFDVSGLGIGAALILSLGLALALARRSRALTTAHLCAALAVWLAGGLCIWYRQIDLPWPIINVYLSFAAAAPLAWPFAALPFDLKRLRHR